MSMVTHISSRRNELIKETAGLVRSVENRRAQGLFVVEGARLCYDACRSHTTVERLFFTQKAAEKYGEYLKPLMEQAREVYSIEAHCAELLSDTRSSQGVFAVCQLPETKSLSNLALAGKYIAVENLQDPGNLGAVMRTAEALGISGLILFGECCDLYSPKTLRAGMGAAFRLPVYHGGAFSAQANDLHQRGFVTYAAVPDSTAEKVTDCTFEDGSILLVGNEGNGLLPETIQACSRRVTIPMGGRAESLNVATSSAILMWEMVR